MFSINVPHATMSNLAAILDCQIGCLPFTYLGLPMGTTKKNVRFNTLNGQGGKEAFSMLLRIILLKSATDN